MLCILNDRKMSRIGNKPIPIPEGVSISVDKNNVLVKGPKGELRQLIDPDIIVDISDNNIIIYR